MCISFSSFAILVVLGGAMGASPFRIGMVKDNMQRYSADDADIYSGVAYWANWVLNKGGLKYGNQVRQVEVLTVDTSTLNSSDITNLVTNAYTNMILQSNIDLVVSPFGSDRTKVSIQVGKKYNRIILGTSGTSPMFSPNSSYFSTISPSTQNPLFCAEIIADLPGVQTYSVFASSDPVAVSSIPVATKYLNNKGLKQTSNFTFSISTTDTTLLTSYLTDYLINFTTNNPLGDVVCVFATGSYFPIIAAIWAKLKPDVKLAAYFVPISLLTEKELTGTTPSMWLIDIPFSPETTYGKSGLYGGTSNEFWNDFSKWNHNEPPKYTTVITVANLMTYMAAVELAQSTDTDLVRQALLDLPPLDTFYGKVKFLPNGTNGLALYNTMQYHEEIPYFVDAKTIIYPAEWPWMEKSKNQNVGMIVGIAVGIAGFVLVSVTIGVFLMRKQRYLAVEALNKAEEGEKRAYKIDFEALEILNAIGSGSFGTVYKGSYRGSDVAVKKLKRQTLTKKQLDEFTREAATMVGLRHPSILLFMGVCTTPPDLCIVTELMPRGSLYDVLHDPIEITFPFKVKMAIDILKGLQFIHSAGFIHRDLKSPNLLIDKNWNIKIADFGLSSSKPNADDDAQISLLWTAPEILQKEQDCYTEQSDIYSFGIILWELMSRKTPFDSLPPATIATRVVSGVRPNLEGSWDKQVQQVIKFSWDSEKANRIDTKMARKILEEIDIGDPDSVTIRPSYSNTSTGVAPSSSGVTFVVLDIANAAYLWDQPEERAISLFTAYHELMRQIASEYRGFISDSSERPLVAFEKPGSAINFCLKLQNRLKELDADTGVQDFTTHGEEIELQDKLPLVQMGVHACAPICVRDPNSNSVKYSGPGVKIADTLCQMAHGGQILFGSEIYTLALQYLTNIEPYSVECMNYKKSKDLPELFTVYQMVPKSQQDRLVEFRVTPRTIVPSWMIDFSHLTLGSVVGSGLFGTVFSAKFGGKQVAFKLFTKQKFSEQANLLILSESAHLRKLNHENVVRFFAIIPKAPSMGFVAEYCSKGSLSQILYDINKDLPWSARLRFAHEAAKGMAYIHSKGVIHGDLKTTNLLLADNWTVKISDLGFRKVKLDNQTMTQVGAVAYTAPEITKETLFSAKADVFSFGIILWEIIFRCKAWEGMHTMKIITSTENGIRPPIEDLPSSVPKSITSILQSCWQSNPNLRPSFDDVISQLQIL